MINGAQYFLILAVPLHPTETASSREAAHLSTVEHAKTLLARLKDTAVSYAPGSEWLPRCCLMNSRDRRAMLLQCHSAAKVRNLVPDMTAMARQLTASLSDEALRRVKDAQGIAKLEHDRLQNTPFVQHNVRVNNTAGQLLADTNNNRGLLRETTASFGDAEFDLIQSDPNSETAVQLTAAAIAGNSGPGRGGNSGSVSSSAVAAASSMATANDAISGTTLNIKQTFLTAFSKADFRATFLSLTTGGEVQHVTNLNEMTTCLADECVKGKSADSHVLCTKILQPLPSSSNSYTVAYRIAPDWQQFAHLISLSALMQRHGKNLNSITKRITKAPASHSTSSASAAVLTKNGGDTSSAGSAAASRMLMPPPPLQQHHRYQQQHPQVIAAVSPSSFANSQQQQSVVERGDRYHQQLSQHRGLTIGTDMNSVEQEALHDEMDTFRAALSPFGGDDVIVNDAEPLIDDPYELAEIHRIVNEFHADTLVQAVEVAEVYTKSPVPVLLSNLLMWSSSSLCIVLQIDIVNDVTADDDSFRLTQGTYAKLEKIEQDRDDPSGCNLIFAVGINTGEEESIEISMAAFKYVPPAPAAAVPSRPTKRRFVIASSAASSQQPPVVAARQLHNTATPLSENPN